jgi:hypothetical protein
MVLPASLAPAFPLRNCPFLVQFIFLASRKLPPDFRMSELELFSVNAGCSPQRVRLAPCDESSRDSPQLRPVFRGGVVISWSNTRRKLCGAKRRLSRVERSEDIFASPARTATVEPTTVDRRSGCLRRRRRGAFAWRMASW